jgi:hypothetical protein
MWRGSFSVVEILTLQAFIFREAALVRGGETEVCIVSETLITPFLTKDELNTAFSGYVIYRNDLCTDYLGVWGKRNGSRLRRFLRERGASLSMNYFKPEQIRIKVWTTQNERARVRLLTR